MGISYKRDTKEHIEINAAINYLIATGHLEAKIVDGVAAAIKLTLKGKDAFFSEYFFQIFKDQKNKRWNNNVTLFFSGAIVIMTIVQVFLQFFPNDKSEREYKKAILEVGMTLQSSSNNLYLLNNNISNLKNSFDSLGKALVFLLDQKK